MKIIDFNLEDFKYQPLDADQQKEWDKGLSALFEDLEKKWPEHCKRMQRMKTQNYKLSLTRVIG